MPIEITIDEPLLFAAHIRELDVAIVLMKKPGYVLSWERADGIVEGPVMKYGSIEENITDWAHKVGA